MKHNYRTRLRAGPEDETFSRRQTRPLVAAAVHDEIFLAVKLAQGLEQPEEDRVQPEPPNCLWLVCMVEQQWMTVVSRVHGVVVLTIGGHKNGGGSEAMSVQTMEKHDFSLSMHFSCPAAKHAYLLCAYMHQPLLLCTCTSSIRTRMMRARPAPCGQPRTQQPDMRCMMYLQPSEA
jgi:hypothetical protein